MRSISEKKNSWYISPVKKKWDLWINTLIHECIALFSQQQKEMTSENYRKYL